jgi:flagellar biosynthesis chaperone FliJ
MKRFHFPLERVLRWRAEQADLETMKLERLLAELRSLEGQRAQLLAERSDAERILDTRQPMAGEELSNLDSFRRYVQARCGLLEGLKQQQESKIAKQRAVLMEARRKYELLQRLRKKKALVWRTDNDQEHEALAAEMFLARRKRS